jgi:hypothetical protein
MKNAIAFLALTLSTSSAFAADTFTCTYASTLDPENVVITQFSLEDAIEEGVQSESINIGRDNYNYTLGMAKKMKPKKSKKYDVNVVFYENNHVLDEVASMRCEYDPSSTEAFCVEPMIDKSGETILEFSCHADD